MDPLVFIICLLQVCAAQGPVYVNPGSGGGQPAAVQSTGSAPLVTQTVYGFLDFTTTIGNTVMIFSPQSAPPPGAAPSPKQTTKTTVIETRPPTTSSAAPPAAIKPSKTVSSDPTSDKKARPASNVEVRVGAPATVVFSSVVEVRKPAASSKVQVLTGPASSEVHVQNRPPSSVVHIVKAPVSKVEVRGPAPSASPVPRPKSPPSSVVEVRGGASSVVFSPASRPPPQLLSSVVEVLSSSSSDDEPALLLGDNALEPEYDFLSRQPSEVVDETYKVINLKPSSKFHLKGRQSSSVHPNHKSSSKHVLVSSTRPGSSPKVRPTPVSSSARILKTAAPRPRPQAQQLEPTPVAGTLADETAALPLEALFSSAPGLTRNQRRPAHHRPGKHDEAADEAHVAPSAAHGSHGKHGKKHSSARQQAASAVRPTSTQRSGFRSTKTGSGNSRYSRPEVSTVSVVHETSTVAAGRRGQNRDAGAPPTRRTSGGSGYKARIQASSAAEHASAGTSVYKFKLNRPSGRWQYKTTPKPRVTIRRGQQEDEENGVAAGQAATSPQPPSAASAAQQQQPQFAPAATPQLPPLQPEPQALSRADTDADHDLEGPLPQGETEQQLASEDRATLLSNPDGDASPPVAETIKVEISTPADFKDVYYEIATIKSPYTFQVGTVRNTRFITVTSTFERLLEPSKTEAPGTAPGGVPTAAPAPAPENILSLEGSLPLEAGMATLPVLTLSPGTETPPLHTTTETFSTTTLLLKTHVLPIVAPAGNTTSRYTLVQSYQVTRHVTATRTLPPTHLFQFEASRALTDLSSHLEEAGSELHLELDLSDNHQQDGQLGREDHARPKKAPTPALLLDAANNQQLQPLPTPPPQPQLTPEQLQQLALLRYLNPGAAAALPQVVTTSRPVLRIETIFDSHVVPVYDGQSTVFSTIRRPVATVSKTEFEYGTATVAPQAPAPQPPLSPLNPLAPFNPLNPLQPQQQFAVTSTPVVTQTVVTETESKILKLTFGAKTAYTTLTSTRVVPTLLTTYVTTSVPVQATAPPAAAFPGFFPSPYAQFPFVG
ncbi:mucin-3A [Schistocerca americana]|uniref:mucin-3A n=1 Tax=Schistocerca americana TaxID=7009 RepID=UPI001F4F69FC|nr:mucin-3A [Schistocerca americana]